MRLADVLIPPSLDAKQALRLRRLGFATLSYALATALTTLLGAFGYLAASVALEVAAAFLVLNLALYAFMRSGLNLRFKDPSLTSFQILAAMTVVMYIVYHMDEGRQGVLFACFIVFLFGIFRFNAREFTLVTLYTLAAYALVIVLLMQWRPLAIHDVRMEWISWLTLAGFLPCFAIIGGHINTLRRRLHESEMGFRQLSEMSSDFSWESDTEHRLRQRSWVNKKLRSVSVLGQGSPIGTRRWELPYLSPDAAGWQAHRALLEARRAFRSFEFSRLAADGSERYISISGDPVFDASGAFRGYRGVGTDITERKQAAAALKHSEENLAITLHSIGDAVIATDAAGRITRMNPTAERLCGWLLADAIDRPLTDVFRIVNFATREPVADPVQLVTTHGQVVALANHTLLLAKDGHEYQIADSAAPIRNAAGEITGVVLVFSDVTEKYLTEKSLREAQLFSDKLLDSLPGIFYLYTYPEIELVRWNKQHEILLGYGTDEMKGRLATDWFSPEVKGAVAEAIHGVMEKGQNSIEAPMVAKDGHLVHLYLTGVRLELQGHAFFVGTGIDITERKAAENQIQALAFSDPLTGLPNRRLLMDRLEQAMVGAVRHGQQGALLFVDMDDFKRLNDSLGHDKGDQLLQQIAGRMLTSVREVDTVARLGGDEFVVLLEDLDKSPQEAAKQAGVVGSKIHNALRQPYQLDSHGYHSSASIGITLFGGTQRENIEEPLKRAELAMYKAKGVGRDNLRFFEAEMRNVINARASLEADLHKALNQAQFLLYYQAQVDRGAHLTGVEALVRWQHPERGLISPTEFIPVAEANGLILPLGHWVLETACKQLALWAQRPEMAHLTISVNVSARQFRLPNFVAEVLAILEATGADPERLKLELTESLLLDNMQDIITKMNALKSSGVGFSLDDFGTGYSSLSYLKRLPLYELKIDQGFVKDILTDPHDAAIAKMVVALADSMGLAVIAEGVETEAQRDALAGLGCYAYQGYVFSRPLPIDEFEAFARGA